MKKVLKISIIGLLVIFTLFFTILIIYNKNNATDYSELIEVVEKYEFDITEYADGDISIFRATGRSSACGMDAEDFSYYCAIRLEEDISAAYYLYGNEDDIYFEYTNDRLEIQTKCELNRDISLKEQIDVCDEYFEFSKNTEGFETLINDFYTMSEDVDNIKKEIEQ